MTVYGRGVFDFLPGVSAASDESVFIYFCLWASNYISIDYMVLLAFMYLSGLN